MLDNIYKWTRKELRIGTIGLVMHDNDTARVHVVWTPPGKPGWGGQFEVSELDVRMAANPEDMVRAHARSLMVKYRERGDEEGRKRREAQEARRG